MEILRTGCTTARIVTCAFVLCVLVTETSGMLQVSVNLWSYCKILIKQKLSFFTPVLFLHQSNIPQRVFSWANNENIER